MQSIRLFPALLFLLPALPLAQNCWTGVGTLPSPAPKAFGTTVVAAGAHVAVAPFASTDPVNVYSQIVPGFTLQTAITPPTPVPNSFFGAALALDGDRIAIAQRVSPSGGDPSVPSGPVLVYGLSSSGAALQASVQEPDTGALDGYGNALALSGDRLLVGAHFKNDVATWSGAAYVYARDAQGNWTLEQKLPNPASPYPLFGSQVALDGDRACVTTGMLGGYAALGGACFYYERGAQGWTLVDTLVPAGATSANTTISSMALDGDRLVLATTGLVGAKRVVSSYRFVAGAWTLDALVEPPASSVGNGFGASVSLDGARLSVADSNDSALLAAPSTLFGDYAFDVYDLAPGAATLSAQIRRPASPDFFDGTFALGSGVLYAIVTDIDTRRLDIYDPSATLAPAVYAQSLQHTAWWSKPQILLTGQSFAGQGELQIEGEDPIALSMVDCSHAKTQLPGNLKGAGPRAAKLVFGAQQVPLPLPIQVLPRLASAYAATNFAKSFLTFHAAVDTETSGHTALYFGGVASAAQALPGLHGVLGLAPGSLTYLGASHGGGDHDSSLSFTLPKAAFVHGVWPAGLQIETQACVIEPNATLGTLFSLTDTRTVTLP